MRLGRIWGGLGMISNETSFNLDWDKKTIEEIGHFERGKSKHRPRDDKSLFGGKYPFVQTGDIKRADLLLREFSNTYNETGLAQSKLWEKGTLCITIAANIAETAVLDIEACFPDSVVGFVPVEDKMDSYFMHYLFAYLRRKIQRSVSGSVQDNINLAYLKKISFRCPMLNERKAITHILSTLDEKIEVNNQINKTLEKMAQAIFKHWFVDFEFPNEEGEPYQTSGGEMVESELGMIPKGWEVVPLQDIADITMGQSPKGTSFNENGEGMVFYQGRTDFKKRFPERRLFTTEPKRMAKKGDILMSVRAPVGDINSANEDCCIGRGLSSLRSKNNCDSYLLYTMFNLKGKFDVFNGEGTVFGSINKNDLCCLNILKAPDNVIQRFEKVVSSFDKKYYTLEMESRNLTKIRDLLLPRLMSGEIRVVFDSEN